MPIIIETRGPKTGVCNICGVHGPLTEDHTPPKGCVRPTQTEIRHLTEVLSINTINKPAQQISQNGIKFRTLCSLCNNGRLGTELDPTLIEFTTRISSFLSSGLLLRRADFEISTKPQRLQKAVLGHMCAQGLNRYDKGPLTQAIADYLLCDDLSFPTGLNMYYWLYPHREQVMLRDAALVNLDGREPIAFWLLKFFPVAFMCTWNQDPSQKLGVQNFDSFRDFAIDGVSVVHILIRPVMHARWPEMPSEDGLVLMGDHALLGTQRRTASLRRR